MYRRSKGKLAPKKYSFDNAPSRKYKTCAKQLLDAIVSGSLRNVQSAFEAHEEKPIMKDDCFLDYELLKIALKKKNRDIINFLLDLKCRVRNPARICSEDTPLHLAVILDDTSIIKKLLRSGASVYDKNKNGETPVQAAYNAGREKRNVSMVHKILNCLYADPELAIQVDPDNKDDEIHFHIACVTLNAAVIGKFIKRGFDINKFISLDYPEFSGLNPVHYAAKKHGNLLKSYMQSGADLSIRTADGLTPLHILKYSDDTRHVIRSIFSFPNDTKYINCVDGNGISHFHLCCTSDNVADVQVFIDNGEDVNSAVLFTSVFEPGYTPLHYAIKSNSLKNAQLLLQNNADCSKQDARGNTPLHLAHRADEKKRLRYVNEIFHRGNETKYVNSVSNSGISHFHLCCMTDRVPHVQQFIENGADVNGAVPLDAPDCPDDVVPGYTPLHFAVKYDAMDVVKLLLRNGADCGRQDRNGDTPLHLALKVADRKFTCVRLIFGYGNETKFANRVGSMGISHFHLCCMTSTARNVQTFIDRGADVDQAALRIRKNPDYPGYTPLHFGAQENESAEVVEALLRNGADCRAVDKFGRTPLHVACGASYSDARASIIEALLGNGAPVAAVDRYGRTTLHVAFYSLRCYETEIFDMLISKMPTEENHTNDHGLSHFHILCTTGHVDLVTNFLESGDVDVDGYVRSGVFKGYAPLHFAVLYNQVDVVRVLLSRDAEVDIRTCRMTPLHLACDFSIRKIIGVFNQYRHLKAASNSSVINLDWSLNRANQLDIIKMLLSSGADMTNRDSQGETALLRAGRVFEDLNTNPSSYAHSKMVLLLCFVDRDFVSREVCYRTKCVAEILLSHGADVNARTRTRKTILHLIAEGKRYKEPEELVTFLVDKGADVNAVDNVGYTPLHVAAAAGHTRIARTLINCKADRDPQAENTVTPLELAYQKILPADSVYDGHIFMVLLKCGCDPDARRADGTTLLVDAIKRNQIPLIEKLLYFGADINQISKDLFSHSWADYQIFQMVFIHMKRLLAVGHPVNPELHKHCVTIYELYTNILSGVLDGHEHLQTSLRVMRNLDNSCAEELRRIRDVKLDQYSTLQNVLTNNSHENSKLVNNQLLLQILEDTTSEDRFTLYNYLLKVQFRKAQIRRDLIESTGIVPIMSRKFNLPEPCCDRIILNLTKEEVLTLKEACTDQP